MCFIRWVIVVALFGMDLRGVRPGGGQIIYNAAAIIEAKIIEVLNLYSAGRMERRAHAREI